MIEDHFKIKTHQKSERRGIKPLLLCVGGQVTESGFMFVQPNGAVNRREKKCKIEYTLHDLQQWLLTVEVYNMSINISGSLSEEQEEQCFYQLFFQLRTVQSVVLALRANTYLLKDKTSSGIIRRHWQNVECLQPQCHGISQRCI